MGASSQEKDPPAPAPSGQDRGPSTCRRAAEVEDRVGVAGRTTQNDARRHRRVRAVSAPPSARGRGAAVAGCGGRPPPPGGGGPGPPRTGGGGGGGGPPP